MIMTIKEWYEFGRNDKNKQPDEGQLLLKLARITSFNMQNTNIYQYKNEIARAIYIPKIFHF